MRPPAEPAAPATEPPGAPVAVAWLGRVGYRDAWALQERLRERVVAGAPAEVILTLEHHPVITLGRSADPANVLVDEAALAAAGVERVATSRGGDVTYHGPGQLVAYPVVRAPRGPRAHVEALAAAVVDLAASLGVAARYRPDCPGVWIDDAKLCAFGVHLRHGVAIHGLALNVTTPLDAFSRIIPCGLRCSRVTSLEALLGPGRTPAVEALAPRLAAALAARLGRPARPIASTDIQTLLS